MTALALSSGSGKSGLKFMILLPSFYGGLLWPQRA